MSIRVYHLDIQINVYNFVGGSVAEAGSPACTHLVIDEHKVKQQQLPFETNHRLHIVKSEVRSNTVAW